MEYFNAAGFLNTNQPQLLVNRFGRPLYEEICPAVAEPEILPTIGSFGRTSNSAEFHHEALKLFRNRRNEPHRLAR